MTNSKLLKEKISQSGYKMKYIANRLEISYYSLAKKIDNITEFKASEIQAICNLLQLSREEREIIFFA